MEPMQAPKAPPGVAAASATDDFGDFGGSGASLPPPSQPTGGDGFGDAFGFAVGSSSSAKAAPAPGAPPPGAMMMDFDLLGGPTAAVTSSGDVLNSTMAQFGMMQPTPAPLSAPTSANDAWLAKLPDLSFVTNPQLQLPV